MKPGVIARQLGLKDQVVDVRRAVKRLIRKKKLAFGPRHLVLPGDQEAARGDNRAALAGDIRKSRDQEQPSKPKKLANGKRVTGVFSRAAAGFGFVRPQGTKSSAGRDDDIFVPANKTDDAANGDTVVVDVSKKRRGKELRWTGEVVEIVQRYTHTFVGSYFESQGQALVQVDGLTFSQPVSVGDPGAKNAQHGDKVVIEMVHFPSVKHTGEAVITKVLGDRNKPGVDTQLVLYEFALPTEFPEQVMVEARKQSEQFDESVFGAADSSNIPRRDLTDVTVLTIDPKDARDFDDAISLRRLDNGNWELGVHIADVSHFVPFNSELDREARDRATSVYLPDRVLPMLPEIISNNLASLQPKKFRYTKTAIIEFNEEGTPLHTDVFSAAIKSDRRFTYEEVDDFLADRSRWSSKLEPRVFVLLELMHQLAMVLRQRRLERGAIELALPEVKLQLDKHGQVTGAYQVEHTESHQIIEEFMLAANEAVARKLNDQEWTFLRRIHDSPDPRKLKQLTQFVQDLGLKTDSLESRYEIKRVLAAVADQPTEHAVNYAVLRSMQKAVYGPDDVGHYALASQNYCHFTSPIRRYPDLTIHRLIECLERGQTPKLKYGPLLQLGEHCSEREQRAQKAERELTKLKLLSYLSHRIGEQMDAIVTGVESYGLFVQGVELPAEGLIHVETLDDDYYTYDATAHSLNGRKPDNQFRLGDILRVEVGDIDMDRREVNFRFVTIVKAAPRLKSKTRSHRAQDDKGKGKGKGKGKPGGKSKDKRKKKKRKQKKRKK